MICGVCFACVCVSPNTARIYIDMSDHHAYENVATDSSSYDDDEQETHPTFIVNVAAPNYENDSSQFPDEAFLYESAAYLEEQQHGDHSDGGGDDFIEVAEDGSEAVPQSDNLVSEFTHTHTHVVPAHSNHSHSFSRTQRLVDLLSTPIVVVAPNEATVQKQHELAQRESAAGIRLDSRTSFNEEFQACLSIPASSVHYTLHTWANSISHTCFQHLHMKQKNGISDSIM